MDFISMLFEDVLQDAIDIFEPIKNPVLRILAQVGCMIVLCTLFILLLVVTVSLADAHIGNKSLRILLMIFAFAASLLIIVSLIKLIRWLLKKRP